MENFLKSRNVDSELIEKMKDDGIDEQVLAKIEIDQLQKYLPKYGDCLAVTLFAKQYTPGQINDRKRSLRGRLVSRLQGSRSEHGRRSTPQEGNKNAIKGRRKIELGWLHEYGANGLKQVRSPNGGGTRTFDMQLDSSLTELLVQAKQLFFPNEISKKGHVKDFSFYITDQTHTKLDLTITLHHISQTTKLKALRFYMVTKAIDDENTLPDLTSQVKKVRTLKPDSEATKTSHEDDTGNDLEPTEFLDRYVYNDIQTPSFDILQQAMMGSDIPQQPISILDTQSHSTSYQQSGNIDTQLQPENSTNPFQEHIQDTSHRNVSSSSTDREQPRRISQDQTRINHHNYQLQQAGLADANCMNITLHRTILQNELIGIFKNQDILYLILNISFVNELGQDADGVSRDAYAGFWDSFYQKNTDGETYRVPILVNEYSQEEWGAIGRILLKGFIDHKYFPVNLAPAFSIALILGEEHLTPSVLKDSFFLFLSNTEKDVLCEAIKGGDYDRDELLGLLDRFQSHAIPHEDELNAFILQVAHRVIIQEPKYALDSMKAVCSSGLRVLLPDIDSILNIYDSLKTTVQKVIKLFNATPLCKEESTSFEYLKRFTRGRDSRQLKRLLRLLTGFDVICVDQILVSFVVRHGCQRIPTIHTCGPSLELPSTYLSFPDFRSEWENILENKESIKMTIA